MTKQNGSGLDYRRMLKAYYELGIPGQLGLSAHSVFSALLHKANVLFFKRRPFPMSGKELAAMSVLSERGVRKAREGLLEFRTDGMPLVLYAEGNRGNSPQYAVVHELLDLDPDYEKIEGKIEELRAAIQKIEENLAEQIEEHIAELCAAKIEDSGTDSGTTCRDLKNKTDVQDQTAEDLERGLGNENLEFNKEIQADVVDDSISKRKEIAERRLMKIGMWRDRIDKLLEAYDPNFLIEKGKIADGPNIRNLAGVVLKAIQEPGVYDDWKERQQQLVNKQKTEEQAAAEDAERREEEQKMMEAFRAKRKAMPENEQRALREEAEMELSKNKDYKPGFVTDVLIDLKEREILNKRNGVDVDSDMSMAAEAVASG